MYRLCSGEGHTILKQILKNWLVVWVTSEWYRPGNATNEIG